MSVNRPVLARISHYTALVAALVVTVYRTLVGYVRALKVTVYHTVYCTFLITCLNCTIQERTIPSQNKHHKHAI